MIDDVEEDEGPLEPPFWQLQTLAESRAVDAALRRRFPHAYAVISGALESGDPLEVVYPDNPNEYNDVVREVMVLMSPRNVQLGTYTEAELRQIVRQGLARCFGEEPEEERFDKVIARIVAAR